MYILSHCSPLLQVAELEEGLGEAEQRCSSLEGEVGGLKEALARAKEEKKATQAERRELTQQNVNQ